MPDPAQRVLAALLSLISLPLVALLGLAIRLESPGPFIHRATRVGAGGRPFVCYKLRSMAHSDHEGAPLTLRNDKRVTRVGRVIRRSHLDELPQLWNVVRGEMRLVGPRPEDPRFVNMANPLHVDVFSSTPGITGISQLVFEDEASLLEEGDPEGSYEAVLSAKLALDSWYLARRSTRLDLWIIGRTLLAVIGRSPTTAAEVNRWR